MLSAWRRTAGPTDRDLTPAERLGIGRELGAGRVLDGGVVGTPAHLVLTASLHATAGGRELAEASVDGPVDSVPVMVDRLAGRLLSLSAGVTASQLASLTTTSLPAIRAYLAGRSAFRAGEPDEAFRAFRDAMDFDSTFALAALELLHASRWGRGGEEVARAKRLAVAGRSRLSPADRALLDIWTGPFPSGPERIERFLTVGESLPRAPGSLVRSRRPVFPQRRAGRAGGAAAERRLRLRPWLGSRLGERDERFGGRVVALLRGAAQAHGGDRPDQR